MRTLTNCCILFFISMISCTNAPDNSAEQPCNCDSRTFYSYFETTKDISDIDSITIEKYPKNRKLDSIVSRFRMSLIKGKIIRTYPQQKRKADSLWSFNFDDSLSSEFDYRLILTNRKGTFKFDLTKITFRKVRIGDILKVGETPKKPSFGCLFDLIIVNGKEVQPTLGRYTISLD